VTMIAARERDIYNEKPSHEWPDSTNVIEISARSTVENHGQLASRDGSGPQARCSAPCSYLTDTGTWKVNEA
jgi:hypothetical protein